jgi:purine-binding chemotaxis protein CheW
MTETGAVTLEGPAVAEPTPVPERGGAVAARLCVFAVGDARFALRMTDVREVMVVHELTPVPCAGAHVLGAANLRGTIVTVVTLEPMLGLPRRPWRRGGRAVVLADATVRVAVAVDEVLDLAASGDAGDVTMLEPATMLAHLKTQTMLANLKTQEMR